MSLTITGLDHVTARLQALARGLPDEVGRAMFEEAEIEMAEAKARTPVDTGALRASGHVEPPERDPQGVSVRLGFGGPSADYAVPVHENLDAFHPVGQAKYLESTLTESAPHLAKRIADRVDLARVAR